MRLNHHGNFKVERFQLFKWIKKDNCAPSLTVPHLPLQFIFTADGWRMYPFSLPLSAPACCWVAFRLSKHRLSNRLLFPSNINQIPKQNYPSQLEKISRYQKKTNQKSFWIHTHIHTHTDLARNVISAYLIIWWAGPQLRGGLRPPGKLSPLLKKCLGYVVCITIVFVHAIDVKFGPPSEHSSSPYCPKLVTGLLVTVSL